MSTSPCCGCSPWKTTARPARSPAGPRSRPGSPLRGGLDGGPGRYVEDLDLRLDDEHIRLRGKGGTVRTVLLDDRGYVTLLKLYLARTSYPSGALFRPSINGSSQRWRAPVPTTPPTTAGPPTASRPVSTHIHQLRHAHAGR
ncbi:hypothetical protein [Actinocrispum wychmicini]|uniref:hypothetical protein n=1 Tax=Actinocrispum wychmicini TaxID=1213861 RepID=UPI001A9FE811|nr:hypothetical protein [Actinocrispum wychmicini]